MTPGPRKRGLVAGLRLGDQVGTGGVVRRSKGGSIDEQAVAGGGAAATVRTLDTIVLPDVPELIAPIVYAVPIQLLAYHTAVLMGTDVDQPRNLAKSVTVE